MTTRYPDKVDNDVTLPTVYDNITEIGGEAINGLKSAVLAIERAVGVNPQGTASSLATRINASINSDGTIKTAALSGLGLVTLPITNAQVGETAGIEESKLDLDYSTASLNADIASLSATVSGLSSGVGSLENDFNGHILGQAHFHDGYDILLTEPIKTQTNVEGAINVVNNELEAHRVDDGAHEAVSISTDNAFQGISAYNVQDALYALDVAGSSAVANLQKDTGGSGIIFNGAAEQSTYGNLRDTTFAATIHETNTITDGSNILQIMRPNAARVSGSAVDFQALQSGVADTFRIQAGGVGRTYLDASLTSVLPTSRLSDVVGAINYAAHEANYPVAAYDVGGRLVIAHNMVGSDFTISVESGPATSAHLALGFETSANQTVTWGSNQCGAFIGGQKITGFNVYYSGSITKSSGSSNQLDLPVSASSLGITAGTDEGLVLVNITNHSDDSTYNGTYSINSISVAELYLSNALGNGTFDVEIVKDCVNFPSDATHKVYDVFMEYDADGYGKVVAQERIQYISLAGACLASVNQDFPLSAVEWEVIDTNYVRLLEDSQAGESVSLPSGFIGSVTVTAYDGVGRAVVEITGTPTSGRAAVTVSAFGGNDDRIYLCSVNKPGTKELQYVVDHRKLGLSIDNKSYDMFETKTDLEQATSDLRNNGVVFGLEFKSYTSNTLTLSGGRAYVDGRKVDVKSKTIKVNEFSIPSAIVLLDRNGNYVIKNTLEGGYSFDELMEDGYGDKTGYATVLEYGTTGSEFDGYFYDRRLVIGNLDKRLVSEIATLTTRIAELEAIAKSNAWAVTIASQDGYSASMDIGTDTNFTSIDGAGFISGDPSVTTRRYEFSNASLISTSQFKSRQVTYINVFMKVTYEDSSSSAPFGTSGDVEVYGGVAISVGGITYEDYALLKQIDTAVLPSNSVVERYVVSVPVSGLYNENNYFMDVVPRIKVVGANYIDGGAGTGTQPVIDFDDVRVTLSSYSVAGDIADDTTNTAISAYVGNIL